jgi:uncharacterized protein (DUF362 family)
MAKQITRRRFLFGMGVGFVSLGLAGCGIRTTPSTGPAAGSPAAPKATGPTTPAPVPASPIDSRKLIISQGSDPSSLIEKGLNAFGGIGRFVQKGSSVVIKPNFSVPRKPEEAATTNPQLVAAVVRLCLAAGAKEVKVFDYPFSGPTCLVTSGIKSAVEAAGGQAYNINTQSHFQQVQVGGANLKSTLFSRDVLNADVFINMPILKHHSTTKVTISLKNMMGLVWDRGYFHRTDLNQCIAEINAYRKPDLIIMDAIRGITDRGPTGPGTIRQWNQVVFGVNPLAVDAYGASLFGLDPTSIGHLAAAAKLGVGEMDLQKIQIQKV